MRPAMWVSLGGLFAGISVALGALGAHVLKGHLTAEQLATFETAVQYQMYHALGLMLVGVLSRSRRSRWWDAGGGLMLAGILLFSGFLYAWVATGWRGFVHPVPLGGIAFVAGWLMIAIGALAARSPQPS